VGRFDVGLERDDASAILPLLDCGGAAFSEMTFENFGAGEGARTLDPDLGKVVLYH
jgi:hypothetical protein